MIFLLAVFTKSIRSRLDPESDIRICD